MANDDSCERLLDPNLLRSSTFVDPLAEHAVRRPRLSMRNMICVSIPSICNKREEES